MSGESRAHARSGTRRPGCPGAIGGHEMSVPRAESAGGASSGGEARGRRGHAWQARELRSDRR
jgi:hypothetical protein